VALPTYGYLLAVDERDRLLGVAAEGPEPAWPPGTRLRDLRAQPGEIAGLVQEWTRDRPMNLQGVLWYRLPTADDRWNWPWPTLVAVMEGRSPRASLGAEARTRQPGLVEIDLVNEGEAELPLAAEVCARWVGPPRLAADALAGFEWRDDGPAAVRWRRQGGGSARIRPGERRMVGWVRLSEPARVEVEVERTP
jgi:hypothetical protein